MRRTQSTEGPRASRGVALSAIALAMLLAACSSTPEERPLPREEVVLPAFEREWIGPREFDPGERRFTRRQTRIDVRVAADSSRLLEARTLRVVAIPLATPRPANTGAEGDSESVAAALASSVAAAWESGRRELPESLKPGAVLPPRSVASSRGRIEEVRFEVVESSIESTVDRRRAAVVIDVLELVSASGTRVLAVATPGEGGRFSFDLAALGADRCADLRELWKGELALAVRGHVPEFQSTFGERWALGASDAESRDARLFVAGAAEARLIELADQRMATLELAWSAPSVSRGDAAPGLRLTNAGATPILDLDAEIVAEISIEAGAEVGDRRRRWSERLEIDCFCPGESRSFQPSLTIPDPCSLQDGTLLGSMPRARGRGVGGQTPPATARIDPLPLWRMRLGVPQWTDRDEALLLVQNLSDTATPVGGMLLRLIERGGGDTIEMALPSVAAEADRSFRIARDSADEAWRRGWDRMRRDGVRVDIWIVDAARARAGCDNATIAGPAALDLGRLDLE
jgi:hypothetical protein